MKQHKWHKEIKAWADGAEIERWYWQYDGWGAALNPNWDERYEYRIKPQPKEPQYLYVFRTSTNGQTEYRLWNNKYTGAEYIGKIKLEVDDETN